MMYRRYKKGLLRDYASVGIEDDDALARADLVLVMGKHEFKNIIRSHEVEGKVYLLKSFFGQEGDSADGGSTNGGSANGGSANGGSANGGEGGTAGVLTCQESADFPGGVCSCDDTGCECLRSTSGTGGSTSQGCDFMCDSQSEPCTIGCRDGHCQTECTEDSTCDIDCSTPKGNCHTSCSAGSTCNTDCTDTGGCVVRCTDANCTIPSCQQGSMECSGPDAICSVGACTQGGCRIGKCEG